MVHVVTVNMKKEVRRLQKSAKKIKVQKLNIFVWIRMQFVLLNFSHKCGLGKPLKSHFFARFLGPIRPETSSNIIYDGLNYFISRNVEINTLLN